MELIGNSERVLLFLLSILGIYNGNWKCTFIRNECGFLLRNKNNKNNLIDENLSKQIFKYFSLFRKTIFENLITKKQVNEDRLDMPKMKINNNKNRMY